MTIYFLAGIMLFAGCSRGQTGESETVLNGPARGDTVEQVVPREMPERKSLTYSFVTKKDSIRKFSDGKLAALKFINRCD
ncbi:MAG TPA: hypothetical protein VEB40_01080, partial [Flavipsychrobacter sp.]|nr:hypothetical protein [Flavipsychrobacter sp.]